MDSEDRLTLATCFIDMRFSPGEAEHAVRLLLSVKGSIQAKHGCHACMIGLEAADASLIHYHEEWESGEDFYQHIHSDEFQRVLIAMDLCIEEPRIVFGNFSGHCGMASLRKLREREIAIPIATE
ncbi:MAG: antibiotic biosynthesis monooxygenase [Candidatus Deferrimicrobiaceae bacterium]